MGWLRFLSFYDAATALLDLVDAAIASLSRVYVRGALPCLGLVGAAIASLSRVHVRDSLPCLTWSARLLLRSAAMHVRGALPCLGLVGAAIASLSRDACTGGF